MPCAAANGSVSDVRTGIFVRKINLLLAFSVAGSIGGSACAMGQPSSVDMPVCTVSGADKLSADLSREAVCVAIIGAVVQKAPGTLRSVDVEVNSASSLSATVKLADGRVLAKQNVAASDRPLGRGSIERFAAAIAEQVAKASSH